MRTRYLRIRPLVYASTSCLLSSSTLNCVFGSVSVTVPSTSNAWPRGTSGGASLVAALAEVPESTYRDSFAGARGKPRSGAGYHTGGRISRIRRNGERVTKTPGSSTTGEKFVRSVIRLDKL